MVSRCCRYRLCGPRPTLKVPSSCWTRATPCGGNAAAALPNADCNEVWSSVPSSGVMSRRLKVSAMSSEGEKRKPGTFRNPSMSRQQVWPLMRSVTRG